MDRKLCSLCEGFDLHALLTVTSQLVGPSNTSGYWPRTPPSFRYQFGLGGIAQGSTAGCRLCTIVWNGFLNQQKDNTRFLPIVKSQPGTGGQFYIVPQCNENGVLLVTNVAPEVYGAKNDGTGISGAHNNYAERFRREALVPWSNSNVRVRLSADRDNLPPGLESFFSYSIPRNRDQSLRMASTWLTACKEQHPLCGIPSPMEMPTRVIDVSTDPPRLFLTNGMSGHYAALSYCWGKVTQMLLKLETLDNFQAKIPFQDMTKTTQDAVIITRSVGIRYLWVDALCIVQNSADDWHSEAAKMKDVYKNALLILNAASAPDAGAGIFPGPDSQNQNFCPIQMLGRNAIEDRTVYMEAVGAGAGFLTDVLRECAVAKRGWCLQESLLSRRTLYFTDQGMLWECASTVEHEDGRSYKFPSKVKSRDTTALYRGSSLMLTRETFENDAGGLRISGSGPSWLHTNDPWKLWDHLVIEYTSRSLTVETDMLTALGGLAEELASVLQCRYHAGLWEKNFVQQMLWTRYKKISVPVYDWDKNQFKPFPFQPKPVSYRAPSWSWAAVNGEPVEYEPINFDEYEMITTTSNSKGRTSTKALRKNIKVKKIFASLVDVQTSLAGKGDYGRIDGGHIILRGNFRTIPSPQYPGRLFASGPIGEYLVAEHYTDAFIDSVPTIATVLEQEFQQQHVPHPNQEFALLEIVRWQVKYGMNPFRSRISSSDKVTFHPLQDYGAYLLVLESVDEEKSAWRRVGLFRVEYTEIGDTKEYAVPANKWQEAYEEVGKKPWEMKDVKIV